MTENVRPFCFVLMPFRSEFNDIYNLGIKNSCEKIGVLAERVDEQYFTETMLERIYRQIEQCDFIIADMTGQNPNVFYEVGYAHACRKICTLLTQNSSDIPFDLKHHAHVIYDGTATNLAEKISPRIKWMKSEFLSSKNSLIKISIEAEHGFLKKSDHQDEGEFNLKVTLKNNTDRRSPEIDVIYISLSKNWTVRSGDQVVPCEDGKFNSTKRHLIAPSIKRLSPGAFSEEKILLSKTFWTMWSGKKRENDYTAKGSIIVEIGTSEGNFEHEDSIAVEFDDFPF